MKNSKIKFSFFVVLAISIFNVVKAQNIETKKFSSRELNEERELKIYIPPDYAIDENKFYPLTVVLDAAYLFDVMVGNAKLFAFQDKAPEQIIVGISQHKNNERYRDCSYLIENSLPTAEGSKFYRFIRSELLNFFEENYRVSPFKTIVGNNLTANFINYFLIEDYPGFNAFINIDPSYALDMPVLLQQKIPTLGNTNTYYYLSNGNYNTETLKNSIATTNALLEKLNGPNFKYKYDFLNSANNTASIGQAIPAAMAFIFEIYSAISKEEFEKNIKHLSPPDAIAYLENKYSEIDYLFGSNLKIRERDIFAIEPIILDKENGDYLKSFGEMINKLYKESPIGDYYLGRYYETGGKLRQALNYYKSGYMKLPEGDPNADGYYQNIERVLAKRDGTYIEPNNN